MTKYCTNCKAMKESWAEHPNYHSWDTYRRYNRCWNCDEWALDDNVTITTIRHAQVVEQSCGIGVGTRTEYSYSYVGSAPSNCQTEDCSRYASDGETCCQICQKNQALCRKIENKTSLSQVKDVEEFIAWWNNNLATAVNGNSRYNIQLLVYDDKIGIKVFQTSSDHYGLRNAKRKASELRSNLNGNNPILYVHPKANDYADFSELVREPYVIKIDVPYETEWCEVYGWTRVPNQNPNNYLKPLDIVWIKHSCYTYEFHHAGVYLGNEEICHFSSKLANREDKKIIITSWGKFIEGCAADSEVFAYHPIIPFKKYSQIAQQIAWAAAREYGKNDYCLPNNNCEHLANIFVYGVDYSKQAKEKSPWFWPLRCEKCEGCESRINNKNKITVNLTNEISRSNNKLGQLNNYQAQQIERRFEQSLPIGKSWL